MHEKERHHFPTSTSPRGTLFGLLCVYFTSFSNRTNTSLGLFHIRERVQGRRLKPLFHVCDSCSPDWTPYVWELSTTHNSHVTLPQNTGWGAPNWSNIIDETTTTAQLYPPDFSRTPVSYSWPPSKKSLLLFSSNPPPSWILTLSPSDTIKRPTPSK